MKDIIKKNIDESDLLESCLRTFGTTIEHTATAYAKARGAKLLGGKLGEIQIDNVWEYQKVIYDLESKLNINLDKGKSRETKAELRDKQKAIEHSFRNERDIISGIIVWTKPTGKDALKLAKKPLKNVTMFGYQDFFKIFDGIITKNSFENMLRRVWNEEIFGKQKQARLL